MPFLVNYSTNKEVKVVEYAAANTVPRGTRSFYRVFMFLLSGTVTDVQVATPS